MSSQWNGDMQAEGPRTSDPLPHAPPPNDPAPPDDPPSSSDDNPTPPVLGLTDLLGGNHLGLPIPLGGSSGDVGIGGLINADLGNSSGEADADGIINVDLDGSSGEGGASGLINADLGSTGGEAGANGLINVDLDEPSGEADARGLINADLGDDGDGLALLSLDDETDSLINVATHDADGGATADVGSLINAAVLDIGGTFGMGSLVHFDAYDGNVPLAGDLSAALGVTLDHLTTTSSLFDVPALDILSLDGLDT
jgi:hypothetical protein